MRLIILCTVFLAGLFLSACDKAISLDKADGLVLDTVKEDLSLPFIDVNGIRLHSESFGDPQDPMLLVLHGGPGGDYRSLLNYKDLASDSFFVVFYDQIGSGLSERVGAESLSGVQVFVEELNAVIDHYRTGAEQAVVLAGHSWGAMLAAAYINQYPAEISGLILSEPGGFNWEQTEAYVKRTRDLSLFGESTNDLFYLDQFLRSEEHEVIDYKLELSLSGSPVTGDVQAPDFWRYGALCNKMAIDFARKNQDEMDFRSGLSSFSAPVLFAYSEQNEAYGRAHADLLASSFPDVQLEQIENCGHEIVQFGWSGFYPLVQDYLKELL